MAEEKHDHHMDQDELQIVETPYESHKKSYHNIYSKSYASHVERSIDVSSNNNNNKYGSDDAYGKLYSGFFDGEDDDDDDGDDEYGEKPDYEKEKKQYKLLEQRRGLGAVADEAFAFYDNSIMRRRAQRKTRNMLTGTGAAQQKGRSGGRRGRGSWWFCSPRTP